MSTQLLIPAREACPSCRYRLRGETTTPIPFARRQAVMDIPVRRRKHSRSAAADLKPQISGRAEISTFWCFSSTNSRAWRLSSSALAIVLPVSWRKRSSARRREHPIAATTSATEIGEAYSAAMNASAFSTRESTGLTYGVRVEARRTTPTPCGGRTPSCRRISFRPCAGTESRSCLSLSVSSRHIIAKLPMQVAGEAK